MPAFVNTQVLRSFRAVFVAALGIFARAQQLHSEGSKDILSPGVVWDALDDLHKLPKSDKNAFRRLILKAYGVVKDTADEFKEAAADVNRTTQSATDEAVGAGTSQSEVATTETAEAPTSFEVGDEVECQFEAELGGYEWFPGKIESVGASPATFVVNAIGAVKVHGRASLRCSCGQRAKVVVQSTHRYNILYDDGDREPNVRAKYVRVRGSGPSLSPAAAAAAAMAGEGGSTAGMDMLTSMMEAMMQRVDDQYTPRDAAIVEVCCSSTAFKMLQFSQPVLQRNLKHRFCKAAGHRAFFSFQFECVRWCRMLYCSFGLFRKLSKSLLTALPKYQKS